MTISLNNTPSAGLLPKAYYKAFALGAMRPHAGTLLPFFNRKNGRFVEIGARDGLKESVTPYLEKALGWKGVLIEPWPHLFHKCRKNRKASLSLNVAVVGKQLQDSFLEIEGLPPKVSMREQLVREANERVNGRPLKPPPFGKSKLVKKNYVTTNSLTAILDRANFDRTFDLLILNLLGYESNALEGMNFERYTPTFLLIRTNEKTHGIPTLPQAYEAIAQSKHDRMSTMHLFRYADFGSN